MKVIAWTAVLGMALVAQTSYYHPGWNLFSPQQDVALGQQAEAQELRQLPIVHNSADGRYLTQLGDKLASHMPGPRFPFNFHLVAQKDINAFALPGGPVFVNVGAVCAARNEAQLAGVVAHEESHVALRHSTSMASKKEAISVPLGILGGIFNSGAGQLANLGAQMLVGGVFLKYSRDMESQADALGAQVMNASGYDPRQMAQFFESLEAQGGSNAAQFLSDHPSPGNREAAVTQEIPTLGEHPPYVTNTPAFQGFQASLCHGSAPAGGGNTVRFQGYQLQPPPGWSVYGDQTSQLTLAPANGLSNDGGQTTIVRGTIVSTYGGSLDQLITELRRSNPDLRADPGERAQAGGLSGTSVMLHNRNAAGVPETDQIVFLPNNDQSALYFIFIAPSAEFSRYRSTFNAILASLAGGG
jgi:hypothetical protein